MTGIKAFLKAWRIKIYQSEPLLWQLEYMVRLEPRAYWNEYNEQLSQRKEAIGNNRHNPGSWLPKLNPPLGNQ